MNKQLNPFYTRWWFWVIVAILLLAVIGMLSDSKGIDESKYNDLKEAYNKLCVYSNTQNGLIKAQSDLIVYYGGTPTTEFADLDCNK